MSFKGWINQRYIKNIITYPNGNNVDKKLDFPYAWKSFAIDELKDDEKWTWNNSLSLLVPEGMVVVDVDNKEEGEVLYQIVTDLKLRTYVEESTKGFHFYFRIPQKLKIKNSTRVSTPLGLTSIDYRCGTSRSCVIQYREGKWSNWRIEPKETIDPFVDLDELPKFLWPLKSNLQSMVGMDEGDGRNSTLNAHRTRMVCIYGYSEKDIRELFSLINTYVFAKPLDAKELESVCEFRDVDRADASQRWFEGKKFRHDLLGEFLIQNLNVYRDESNRTFYFNNEIYESDDRVIEEKIVELAPTLTTKQRAEVLAYVKLAKIKSSDSVVEHHPWIACSNCLVDATTSNVLSFTPKFFITNQLDVEYDPLAYDEHVDKFLNDVLVEKGDKEQRMIFEEYLGYTLIAKDNFMKKMLFMIGETAGNGKSTTQFMVQQLLTQKNYSPLKLSQISEQNAHALVELCDKLANFEDDAESSQIKGSSMSYLKTIISDENRITINPKFKQPYTAFIRAKFWIASNHIIRTEQKGNEWMNRLLVIAFENQFTGQKIDRYMKRKISTPRAKSYLLKLAIEGFQRLIKNGDFTVSPTSQKWLNIYRIENDNAFKFFYMKKFTPDQLDGKTLKSIHILYKNFLEEEESSAYAVNLNNFERRLKEYYNGMFDVKIINNDRVIVKREVQNAK